jgi:nucleoside-diphosphate-sugar epimerase
MDQVPECTRLELSDRAGLEDCVRRVQPDFVFHLAGSTSDRGRDKGCVETAGDRSVQAYDVNLIGALRVLQATASQASSARVIRCGSLAEYGDGPVPFREDQREQPVSVYAASQVAATHMGQAVFRQSGLPVTTVRLALTYGPAQSNLFLIPSLILAGLRGLPFDMTDGTQTRDFIYVDDAVEGLLAVAAAPGLAGEVINIGSGEEHAIGAVAAQIVRLTGGRTQLRLGALVPVEGDLRRLVCDPDLSRRVLGWSAATPLEAGLMRAISWYREHQAS